MNDEQFIGAVEMFRGWMRADKAFFHSAEDEKAFISYVDAFNQGDLPCTHIQQSPLV